MIAVYIIVGYIGGAYLTFLAAIFIGKKNHELTCIAAPFWPVFLPIFIIFNIVYHSLGLLDGVHRKIEDAGNRFRNK